MKQSQDNIFYIKNNNIVEVDEKLVQRNTPWLLNNYEDDVNRTGFVGESIF